MRCAVILEAVMWIPNKYDRFFHYARLYNYVIVETARLRIQEYSWFYVPVCVHKIPIHGSEIPSTAILPIGQVSEEAQESRNRT